MDSGGFLQRVRGVWDEWILRVAVLSSLLCQLLLIVWASFRRRTGSKSVKGIIWCCYLLADWTATFGIGLISSGLTSECSDKTLAVDNKLAAFWAPFLLLHLGGPDTITAFSLEDNELWIRHLMGLLVQILVVVLVFVQSLQNDLYWIPTLLLFLVGASKYAERTLCLYRACLENFKKSLFPKPDPGPNYGQLMEDVSMLEAFHVPVTIKVVEENQISSSKGFSSVVAAPEPSLLDPSSIVHKGYDFFMTFKGLIVDHMFSFHERDESRMFFFNTKASDAFQVMEVELNFIYDVFYTKMALLHCKKGYAWRFLCTAFMVACFQQFASLPHNDMFYFDKVITYILLVGAVAFETVSLMNIIFSDWALVSAKGVVADALIRLRFGRRRWSNTIGQHSFITLCINKERFAWLKKQFQVLRATKKEGCEEALKELIFKELKAKAMKAGSRKKLAILTRGEDVLSDYPSHLSQPSIWASLSDEVEYDESLLLWHIATDLCYFTTSASDRHKDHIKNSKHLSDYMFYLLARRPKLMSTVAGIAQIRFQDTLEEAKKFFKRWHSEITTQQSNHDDPRKEAACDDQRKRACEKLLAVKIKVKPNQVKGDKSKSLLFDACILAKDLKEMNDDRRWEMISRVWVEQLSHAAIRCRASDHARQLSRGGEFITFVWLLMVHFGLGEQFETGQARAKLLVAK